METKSCCVCQKPKPNLECGLCKSHVCKNCAQFLEEDQFSFLPKVPKELKHSTYCGPCFTKTVVPAMEEYAKTMEQAENITVYFLADSKITRNFKRNQKLLEVKDCDDREEALMRLAFLAANAQFNAIIDVDITSQKIRTGSYQTTKYGGSGMPTQVNLRKRD